MKRIAVLVLAIGLGFALTPAANAWISYLDFNDSLLPPNPPWEEYFNEGTAEIVDVGGGNMALRMGSPDHSADDPPPMVGDFYNEYFMTRFGAPQIVGAARFRLVEFGAAGSENLLSVAVGGASVGGTTPVTPSITLVNGNYHVWSYATNGEIFDLGPAVANEWHEVYILASSDGTAKVWWDGTIVVDGPVAPAPDFNGYVEIGSYWQTSAHTVADFDWIGSGDPSDFPVPPGVTGDCNGNGVVDAADYVVWRDSEGSTNSLPHDPLGGTIGQDQYDNWRARFGETAPTAETGQSAGAVPEPATWVPLLVSMLTILTRQRAAAR